MKVLIDTAVWSLVLRRRKATEHDSIRSEVASLITDGRVAIIGAIRQEVLSGIREPAHFERLREDLRAFPDLAIATEDYEDAAAFHNLCRRKGVQGSNTDFLICAIAARHGFSIFTTDNDFKRFVTVLPITLHES